MGSPLLERVDGASLASHLDERFRRRAGRAWTVVAAAIPDGGVPHHDFHVFGVYPWVGLLRSGDATEPLRVLESCRITPARVLEVGDGTATVEGRPLVWDGVVFAWARAPHGERTGAATAWGSSASCGLATGSPCTGTGSATG